MPRPRPSPKGRAFDDVEAAGCAVDVGEADEVWLAAEVVDSPDAALNGDGEGWVVVDPRVVLPLTDVSELKTTADCVGEKTADSVSIAVGLMEVTLLVSKTIDADGEVDGIGPVVVIAVKLRESAILLRSRGL